MQASFFEIGRIESRSSEARRYSVKKVLVGNEEKKKRGIPRGR